MTVDTFRLHIRTFLLLDRLYSILTRGRAYDTPVAAY